MTNEKEQDMVWLIGSIIVIAAVFGLLWRTSTPPVAAVEADPEPAGAAPDPEPADRD